MFLAMLHKHSSERHKNSATLEKSMSVGDTGIPCQSFGCLYGFPVYRIATCYDTPC